MPVCVVTPKYRIVPMLAKAEQSESGSHLIFVRTKCISESSILLIHTPEFKWIV